MATTNDNPDHDINGHHDEHLIMMTLVTKITIWTMMTLPTMMIIVRIKL